MLEEMSADELRMWIAYAQVEPFGEVRSDVRMAILASTVSGSFSGKPISPTKFLRLLSRLDRRAPQDFESIKSAARAYAQAG